MRISLRPFLAFLFSIVVLTGVSHSLAAAPEAVKIGTGKKVTLFYKLFVEGELLEEANTKEPFIYTHGSNQIVPGLEKGLTGLKVGDRKTIRVSSEEAFGPVDQNAFKEIEKSKLPAGVAAQVGTILEARSPQGERILVRISKVGAKRVQIDFNHPLAGKDLEFQVEVTNIV